MLYISKDIGMKEPYTGSFPILTGEIGDNLTEYFYASEPNIECCRYWGSC